MKNINFDFVTFNKLKLTLISTDMYCAIMWVTYVEWVPVTNFVHAVKKI